MGRQTNTGQWPLPCLHTASCRKNAMVHRRTEQINNW